MIFFRSYFKYIYHFVTARNTRGFGVHSPFVFQFTRFVICEKNPFYNFIAIENLRNSLKKDKSKLLVTDFGTGTDNEKTVSTIAKHSLKPAKQAQLLFRICYYFKSQNVLELGTSLGITTSYLASASAEIKCVSLEGCPEIAHVASDNFEKLGLKNIEIVVGNIDDTLEHVLNDVPKLDLIFIDANHRSEAVIKYFELCLLKGHNETVFVIDDIYWSNDMEKAWSLLKVHPSVTTTIDLFCMGIIFLNKKLTKTNYIMRY